MGSYSSGLRGRSAKALGRATAAQVRILHFPPTKQEKSKIMDKITEKKYTGYYNSKNDFSITGVSNNAVTATDFNKLIDEVNTLHFQIKNLKEIQKWKNWRFR